MELEYKYTNRAVAFLDVLGFQNKLEEFEKEAIEFYNTSNNEATEQSLGEDNYDQNNPIYYSQKASDFINTFNSAISKLDSDKFSYYLFSDNICITAKGSGDNGENSLEELLLIISELYFEFIQKGYFLRGGIDYGLFIDISSIALGVPLATAYKMESTLAVFPRIILSKNFIKQFEDYSEYNVNGYSSIIISSLIKVCCDIKYLNVFIHIFKVDDKEYFFEKYSIKINENLQCAGQKENIFLKYKWLATEFNSFIETYTSSLAFLDENFDATEEYLLSVNQLKVEYGQ
jgi:hypothetical protein